MQPPNSPPAPRALVTGAASGIGLALSQRLLAAGWSVLGLDRQAPLSALPAGYTHWQGDLADVDAAAEAAEAAAITQWLDGQPLTAFVHAAGAVRSGGAHDTRSADADLLYRLHVGAAIRLMRTLAPRLPAQRGRVVLVASRGVLGRANRAPYAASKAAQQGLARSWACELIGQGITVNVVAPGAVDTPQLSDPQRGAPPLVKLPLGRLIRADEVAASIAFLLGEEAGAITGQTLFVCGGASLDAPNA